MRLENGIRHILFGSLAFLLVTGLSATYWAIAGRDSLLLRDDNPRRFEALAAIQRGGIYDHAGQLLAESIAENAVMQRRYDRPAAFGAVGYYSLRFGLSGAEAAFDDLLSGSSEARSLQEYVERNLLRNGQVGSDIRLSIDADLQDALASALGGARGAAIVLRAWTGEIAALISQPSVDANGLDDDWEELVADEGRPFFNRALQGNYQLGGAMYTVLLAQAISSRFDLSQRFPQSSAIVAFEDGVTLGCAIKPAATELTLADAYAYGCPAPFRAYYVDAPRFDLDAILKRFAFDKPITLNGFPQPVALPLQVARSAVELDDETRGLRAALGQGDLTATPLHMAAIMAAVATDGGIRKPRIHLATRAPGAQEWQEIQHATETIPVFSAEVAQDLRAIMRQSWSTLNDGTDRGEVGAQIATSQSGEASQIWLNGYSANDDGEAYAFAIIVEDSADDVRMLSLGQTLIEALENS